HAAFRPRPAARGTEDQRPGHHRGRMVDGRRRSGHDGLGGRTRTSPYRPGRRQDMKREAGLRPDPFTIEVIRNALTAIAEEMSLVIMRSARSPLLREAGDLSSALTDADGGLIAQGRDIPAHLGIMGSTVQAFLGRVPKE